MTREEMIQKMLEDVNDWDLDALVDCVIQHHQEKYEKMTDKEICDEYNAYFGIESKSWFDKVVDALKLMVYERRIYTFLKENDPKALEQVLSAIKLADPGDKKTDEIVNRWNTWSDD